MTEKLYFDEIKELRDKYMATYRPPVGDMPFATLSMTFIDPEPSSIEPLAAEEMKYWLGRYSVPIFASFWTLGGDQLGRSETESHCAGWIDTLTGTVRLTWSMPELNAFVETWKRPSDWRAIYSDVPVRTQSEVTEDVEKEWRKRRPYIRLCRVAIILWAVAVPAAVAVVEYFGPQWLALLALLIALANSWHTLQRLRGLERPSKKEELNAAKKRRMEYYYYHCERNPTGFARLLSENVSRDEEERKRKEIAELAERDRKNG